jgi:hypothetical protein
MFTLMMKRGSFISVLSLAALITVVSSTLEANPGTNYFDKFQPLAALRPSGLVLKRGDRLAICGDSITEQKKYSRIMEDYLNMCVPQLDVSVRQFGWGGETAAQFLLRMTNDCLRFNPSIATTSYGMNDHHYKPYEDSIGQAYRSSSISVVEAFKAEGARVIVGSPGCIAKIPWWEAGKYQVDDLNMNLCRLRNIDIEIAREEGVGFADVFWPLLTLSVEAKQRYGDSYALTGDDGIHPQWAGHIIMAYAYLKSMGLDGNLATFNVDLKSNKMRVSAGHKLISSRRGEYKIRSTRYPFCPCVPAAVSYWYPACNSDDVTNSDSIRSGMSLIPFNQELNRFMLTVTNGTALNYLVVWGDDSRTFTSQELVRGINLAAEFQHNPFSDAFSVVDTAVALKQDFETREIKGFFRLTGIDKPTIEQITAQTDRVVEGLEKEHAALVAAVHAAFMPVTYTIKIVPQ